MSSTDRQPLVHGQASEPRRSLSELQTFAERVLIAAGVGAADAATVATCLVDADARGIASHGVSRLTLYAAALLRGGITARPEMLIERRPPASAVIDADFGLGHLAMDRAVHEVSHAVQQVGIAIVMVKRSTHFGIASHWTERVAQINNIGIAMSTTAARVAPFGGRSPLFGTNPLAISLPSAEGPPVTLDFAISRIAHGKIAEAHAQGKAIPPDCAIDAEGQPTTDPAAALGGALVAFGGAKGSGLGFMIEGIIAGLSGSCFSYESGDIWADPSAPLHVGHILVAIAPAGLGALDMPSRVASLRRKVRASPPLNGEVAVLAPGDRELAARDEARHAGIRLPETTAAKLRQLAIDLDIPPLSDEET